MGEKPEICSKWRVKRVAGALMLLAVLVLVSAASITVGSEHIPLQSQIKVLSAHLFGSDIPQELSVQDTIIWQMRLPRTILAVLVGVLLAAAGAALQGLLRNPLADPYTVGVSSGAALGASVAFTLGLSYWVWGFGIPAAAFMCACAAMFIVYSLARFAGRVSVHSFLLAGIVVGSFLWAALTFVLSIAGKDAGTIIRWLLGSFAVDNPWSYALMVLPFAVLGLAVLYAMSRDLNVYALGEDTARHLGIETESLKIVIIVTTSLITAAAVSVSGIIGFVGLMVPHIARKMFGPDHRVLLPMSALTGAALMVTADTAARMLGELPVGVITALLGAPFFLFLLRSRKSMER